MLTKVIDQSKIDHFAKWLERADKIVIVAHKSHFIPSLDGQ